MKHFLPVSAILALLFLSSCMPPQTEIPDEGTVTYQEFYDQLSPYGHWVQHPQYGYVWIPEAGPDFVPYSTGGYWVWSDGWGWVWTSDYPWGWAPFHYGRWDYADDYGWYWVPDYVWGPAWVAWRQCPGYYGWCPLRPGISIDFAIGGRYDPDDWWWTACDGRYMGRREMRDHYEHGQRDNHGEGGGGHEGRGVIGRIRGGESRPIGLAPEVSGGKRGFVTGPGRKDVEAVTHIPIQPIKVVTINSPGEALANGTLSLYRPQAQKISNSQTQGRTSSPGSQQQAGQSGNIPPPSAPRSVTTTKDIQDLHRQANPQSAGRPQSAPAPRQPAPRPAPERPTQQPSAPRGNAGSNAGTRGNGGGGGGRPK